MKKVSKETLKKQKYDLEHDEELRKKYPILFIHRFGVCKKYTSTQLKEGVIDELDTIIPLSLSIIVIIIYFSLGIIKVDASILRMGTIVFDFNITFPEFFFKVFTLFWFISILVFFMVYFIRVFMFLPYSYNEYKKKIQYEKKNKLIPMENRKFFSILSSEEKDVFFLYKLSSKFIFVPVVFLPLSGGIIHLGLSLINQDYSKEFSLFINDYYFILWFSFFSFACLYNLILGVRFFYKNRTILLINTNSTSKIYKIIKNGFLRNSIFLLITFIVTIVSLLVFNISWYLYCWATIIYLPPTIYYFYLFYFYSKKNEKH